MTKILNKFIFHLKNILLPVLLIATIYIVSFMFQRLGKDIFGENLLEFVEVIGPFVLLIILNLFNLVLNQKEVSENLYYNLTSFLVMVVIAIFCIRACFDSNMYFLHQYSYNINFNYFADQIAAIKVMLYGLSFGNIILMIANYIKVDEEETIDKKDKNNKNHVVYSYEKENEEDSKNKSDVKPLNQNKQNNKKMNKK